jgi:hypothetical protein
MNFNALFSCMMPFSNLGLDTDSDTDSNIDFTEFNDFNENDESDIFSKENIDIIGLEDLLSIVLVKENVRPSMMLVNYTSSKLDNNTKYKLNKINELFPNLKQTNILRNINNTNFYNGTIISKDYIHENEEVKNIRNMSNDKLGKILGYPCYEDANKECKYIISISCVCKNRNNSIEFMHNNIDIIINNACDKSKLNEFQQIAEKAEKVLLNKYKFAIFNREILKVEVNIKDIITPKNIITDLLNRRIISHEKRDEVLNILYNCGFDLNIQCEFEKQFQYENNVHIGILLQILNQYENNPMEPFFPLQNHPVENKKIHEIEKTLGIELINIIKFTRIDT